MAHHQQQHSHSSIETPSTPHPDDDDHELWQSSPIKIDLDYDVQHNLTRLPNESTASLNRYHTNDSSTSLISTNSLLPPNTTYTIIESPTSQQAEWLDNKTNPFNFTPITYDASKPENFGKRKGHKYKHSSIHTAHQIFQPPTPRAPLTLPASLPVPTRREAWLSLSRSQNLRLMWCLSHIVVAGLIQFAASGSLALTALSRLMFFDAAGAVSCVAVDVMTNFEVWSRSTIRHPFGLGRADVLAGFGMAVFIAFMGLDIISHGTQHALENLGNHEAHSSHSHERPSTVAVLLAAGVGIVTTLISAIALGNHSRIGRTIEVPAIARWGVLGNPSHFLTISCCAASLALPTLNNHLYTVADPLFAFIIAGSMIAFGVRLGSRLGNILLMAYTHPTDKYAVSRLVADIETDPAVSQVEEAKIWQVHYGLGLADLKLRCHTGQVDDISKLRSRISNLIKTRLGPGEGRGPRWDISVQISQEKD